MTEAAAEDVALVTFGCRLNGVESEAMRRAAVAAGHRDLIIVNTCAVTAEAVRQARQTIRRAKRQRPHARLVVTGCAAQVERAAFAAMPEVAAVVDNLAKTRPEVWRALRPDTPTPAALPHSGLAHEPAVGRGEERQARTRAFVAVQNGCDHRCTFCIIPYGRGRSRSTPPDAVLAQVRGLVDAGHHEVVLTGVDLTSYGGDLDRHARLGRLVARVLREVPGLARLRLSSLDCIEADPELLDALAHEPRLMPHLHLSLQAGDDLILKRMKRRHSSADAIAFCDTVRKLRPDIVLGADIIVGFPTETEAMFRHSLDLVAACGLTHLHVFPYSVRPGTPAARMPQVAAGEIRERAARLRAAGAAALQAQLAAANGKRLTVLAERGGIGRAEDFTPVRLPGVAAGRMLEVGIVGHDGAALLAAGFPPAAAPC